jgi:hypothetical protein
MAPLVGGRLCFAHDPKARQKAAEARSKGGQRTATRAKRASGEIPLVPAEEANEAGEPWWSALYTAWDIENALAHVALAIIAGKMSARDGAVATRALSVLLDHVRKYGHSRQASDLDDTDTAEEVPS